MTNMDIIQKFKLSLTGILLLTFAIAQAQDNAISNIPEGRYLVIGSFHIKKNAIGFVDYVHKMDKYDVKMAYHPKTQFYHVYIKGYAENENGFVDVDKMRKQTEFIDTWFMIVEPYEIEAKATPATIIEENQDADTGGGWIKAASPSIVENTETTTDSVAGLSGMEEPKLSNKGSKIIPKTYETKGKYKLYFNTYYVKNFKEIKGPVEIINPKSLFLLRVVQSLELVLMPDPNNGTHSLQLIANIFGYKKVQHDIRLNEPFDEVNEEFFHFKGDTLMADFPLQRYETGDIATMYNVFFFKDAVVMKPNSKFELNSLVDMLKENDELKIRIHGHTNGNSPGKIILIPDGSEKFFTLHQEVKEKTGSAKELSLQRAEIIKKYLVSYGIDASRMQVIGWGGKKAIYPKMDKLAIKNVRVEIEILEN